MSYTSTESIKALNGRLHWGKRGTVYQHDPRRVGVVAKDLGLEHGNSVQTPATHDVTEEEPAPLDQVQHSRYKSLVERCFFLSQDRADTTFTVNKLSKDVKPTQQSLAKLKRLVKYLKRERQREQRFSHRRMVEKVTTCSDSEWSGCKTTRQSSSASVILQAKYHYKKQGRSRAAWRSIGSI